MAKSKEIMVLEPKEPYIKIIKNETCAVKKCSDKATHDLGCLRVCKKHYDKGRD